MNESMVRCEQCGAICNIKDGYCKKCWKKLPVKDEQEDFIIEGIGQAEWERFIDKNSARYVAVFKKNNGKNFFLNINWSAFFFGINWMLYRKMYKFAIVSFFASALLTLILTVLFYIPYIDEIATLNNDIIAMDEHLENGGEKHFVDSDGITHYPEVVKKAFEAERRMDEIELGVTLKSLLSVPICCLIFGFLGDALYKRYVLRNIKSKEGGTSISSVICGRVLINIIETLVFSFLLPLIALILIS